MRKGDIYLIIIILLLVLPLTLLQREGATRALVYYEQTLVKTIDLSIPNIYEIKGELGPITLEVKANKIRVRTENSPLHLCSKKGWVEDDGAVIVCLPNKVVIKLIVSKNQYDVVVR